MNPVVTVVGGLVVAGVVALGVTTAYVRRHPLETFIKLTRRGMRNAGFARKTLTLPDGTRIVYFEGGRGARTVVLVHGVNDQAGTWVSVAGPLAKEFRVIAIDLPGHGESGPATGPLPMTLLTDALTAVIDRHPQPRITLVGNSMGGWVSMLYAADHPSRVEHLVLEDSSGMTWDLSDVPLFPKNREEALRLMRMVYGPEAKIADAMLDSIVRLALTRPQARVLEGGIVGSVVDGRLASLTMPVTLIWGAHDGILPRAYAEALHARIPGATLQIIEAAAHIPHRQAPAEFLRVLRESLRASAGAAAEGR